ncbi:LysR family transcriptional regulator [Pseudomonas syringae]|nr:LysR family transcriptional regulator [Pseudomonas syringae]
MRNDRQLHYFWVVAKTGSIGRACEQLNLTAQTVSGQISLLEASLGVDPLQRVGRHLRMTERGRLARPYAEQMSPLGSVLDNLPRPLPE